jgi:uncharacterized protein (DUF433 family)
MEKLIIQDSNILGGKPIVAGTRIAVETILELLASGMETEDILKEYPFLNDKQVRAAVEFAAKMLGKEESYLFKKSAVVTHEIPRRR